MYNKWRRESFRNPVVLCCVCDPMLFDAGLSPAGEVQVRHLHDEARSAADSWLAQVELVVTSPLRRAIETCLGAFFPESSYIMSPKKWGDGGSGDGGNGGDGGDGSAEVDLITPRRSYGAAPLCCSLPGKRWTHHVTWGR